jgi:SecD/SecF fusion protein
VQSEVGPSLGQEAIDNGTNSAIIGLLLVSLWMMIMVKQVGMLILHWRLTYFSYRNFSKSWAVLTLPGIAGIVLTMGTAVDANIIIYERAKKN